jgi:DNA processing protein
MTSTRTLSDACDACLRRGHLVGFLAGRIAGMIAQHGSSRCPALLALGDDELIAAVGGRRREAARRFVETFDPGAARGRLAERGVHALCGHATSFPQALEELPDVPPVLFARGSAERLHELNGAALVTVVGARRPSPWGADIAYELGRGLGAAGVVVVSGLALGVDGAAHRGCLDAGGRAVAVLGCGPDVPYPATNRRLHERVAEAGLVLSELPPGQRPYRWSFPARNRIMAALAAVTVVVEAADPSGSLITSDFAMQLDRTVAAVPGRAGARLSAGTNGLLKAGALLVTSAQDVLDELFGVGAVTAPARAGPAVLDPVKAAILDAVEAELAMDELCAAVGLPVRETRAALSGLEALGYVKRDALGAYRRTAVPR